MATAAETGPAKVPSDLGAPAKGPAPAHAGAAGTTAAGHAAAARWLGLRPPQLALALALLALTLHGALQGRVPQPGPAPWIGGGLALAGLAWTLWAAWLFRRAATPIRPTDMPLVLVDEGPYRFGRHPMYLGLAVLLAGGALAVGAPALLLAAMAFVAIVRRVHIPHEEAQLRQRFGGWYSDYAADVRRWL